MRVLITGISAMCLAMMLLVFWRVHAVTMREIAVLTGGVDEIASDWESHNTAPGMRVINFLLSDTRAASAPLLLSAESEGGFMETAGGWVSRNLIGGSPVAQAPTELERAFSDSTGLVRWTHKGYDTVAPHQMISEIEKAILRAHDRGAEINIVAQGEDAGPVLIALARLEGQVRGGVPVGANKVVFVGMSEDRLKRKLSSWMKGGYRVPGNILQLANVWTPRGSNGGTRIQVFGGGRQSEVFEIDSLWPPGSDSSDPTLRKLKLVRGLLESRATFEAALAKKEADLQAAIAAAVAGDAAKKNAAAQAAAATAAAGAAAAKTAAAQAAAKPDSKGWAGATAAIKWVRIPGGVFNTGWYEADKRDVTVRTFEIAKTEVTNAQYRACVNAGACAPPFANCMEKGSYGADDQPVVCVNHAEATAFAKWAGGRLPTSVEWEFAARSGGRELKYPWGDEEPSCRLTVVEENGGKGCGRDSAAPVCSRPAGNTAQGLCDMSGNADEWAGDCVFHKGNGLAPDYEDGVVRGGSWYYKHGLAVRESSNVTCKYRFNYMSFRPARNVK